MTRKTLITALLFIFILSACGSNVETIQPTSTLFPTLQATSTFTPEPTATNTPIPTATPFRYTSCSDSKLINEVVSNFETRNGMTLDQAYDLLRKDPDFGIEATSNSGDPAHQITTRIFYLGNRLVSGESIPGGQVKNVLCAYGRIMAPLDDGSYSTVPVPLGWEDMQGNFHYFVYGRDRASVTGEGDDSNNIEAQKKTTLDSLTTAQQFLDGIPDGAIIKVNIRTFSRLSNVEDIVELTGEAYDYTNNLQDFLRMLGKQWADRNFDQHLNGIPSTLSRVSPEAGDQGLYSSSFTYWDEGRLHPGE